MRLLRPSFQEVAVEDTYEKIPEGVLSKKFSQVGEDYEYIKKFTLNESKYYIVFEHCESEHEKNQFSVHFGLVGVEGNPVTNAGLPVFGKIVDEMSAIYEEICTIEQVDSIRINASPDVYSKDELEKVKEIIAEDSHKLDGLTIAADGYDTFSVTFNQGVAVITTKGKLGASFTDTIPLALSFFDDIKHIAKIDMTEYVTDMLNYMKGGMEDNKKQIQRLKLYQFYLHKRYPQFTFNSKEIVTENGKKELVFKKDEHDEPFLLVATHNRV